jgi:Reverse transcriptase (RNA-dependent DNA polymerase)
MCKEVTTLTDQKDAWEVVLREAWMNVLPSTWAFKCKRFPDGLIKKLKARFCVRGDKQLEGVDFFETFAPVVSWSTIRLMLILSLVLGLATRQVDYTAAFLHAPIDEDVYVEMPRGFSEPGKVLKLKKSLYGLKQAPRNFFQHLKNKLERIGFTSSSADPCLFISERVICIVYVDDTLLFSPRQEYIDDVLSKLKEEELDLEEEDDVAGFLGVNVQRDDENGQIHMTQLGLIDRIIDALGCDSLPGKRTPAEHGALGSDKGGDPPQASFSYASVIGMLQYLQAHTRPDITLAVSQCARFIHSTRRSHELALIRIGQYLKLTRTRGLTLRPTTTMSIDCYVDADFAGLWGFEDPQDPTCVKSRTGYVLCLAGCPIIWASKLQSDIALSTMEAEYNALSMALKELLPLKRLVETVAGAVQIPLHPTTAMRVTVWEDNTGALTLANLEPGRMTPRSKHYGVKYHWFREHLKPNCIEVVKIDTDDQQADILTKALRTHKFEHNRRQLMGWSATLWGSQLRSKGSVKILANTVRYHASPGIARLRAHQSRYT